MTKTEERKGFCVFYDWMDDLSYLSGEDAWAVMQALSGYYRDGINPIDVVDDHLKAVVSMMFHQILRREEVSAKRAENARVTNEKKKAVCEDLRTQSERNANAERTQRVATDTDTDTITDTDTVIIPPPTPSKGGKACADRFTQFWDAYPRKEGKERARQAWKKLKPDEDLLQRMLDAIELQKRSDQWQRDSGAYIPHPATWLNGKRWEDEVKPPASGNMFADYLMEMRQNGGIFT